MRRILIIDDDVDFIIKVQKLMPQNTEWLASVNVWHIKELVQQQRFDYIVARKKFKPLLSDLVGTVIKNEHQEYHHPFHKIIVLPDILWKIRLRNALGGGLFAESKQWVPVV